jgi:PIN domain nuclease of toxin-antitoxin system
MRYYLDANTLIFILLDNDCICKEVSKIIEDPCNLFYVSSIAVREMLHLYKAGKIGEYRYKKATDILEAIENVGIEIKPLNKYHLSEYAKIDTAKGHNDPNDHVIISQAIADKITLISSDRKFQEYTKQNLSFIFNKR